MELSRPMGGSGSKDGGMPCCATDGGKAPSSSAVAPADAASSVPPAEQPQQQPQPEPEPACDASPFRGANIAYGRALAAKKAAAGGS